MMKECENCKHENKLMKDEPCRDCLGSSLWEPMTNADRMDAMSIMEKAKFLTSVVANGCPPDMDCCCEKDSGGWDACDDCWCEWLQQPAGGADHE